MATPTTTPGQVTPGNIDLNNRPIVANSDGSYSTVRSITITVDGKAVLIPTVVGGKVVSNDEAIAHYRKTGENLGTFTDESRANAYAQQLHEQQAAQYSNRGAGMADKAPTKVFTSEDLAKLISTSPNLDQVSQNQPTMPIDKVTDLIISRLKSVPGIDFEAAASGRGNIARGGDIAQLIAGAIPANLHTVNALAAIDLRPYLKAIDGKTILDRRWDDTPSKAPVTYKATTAPLVDGETKRLETATNAKAPFVDGTAGVNPVSVSQSVAPAAGAPGIDPTTGLPGVLDPTTGQWIGSTIDQASGAPQFPVASMRRMVSDDLWSLAQLADNEATQNAKLSGGSFPVDVGTTGRSMADTGSARGQGQVLSVASAIDFIHSLKPSEIENVQHKLAAGGYFDKLPNGGGTFTPGDSFDQNTMDAWKLLLTDSVKQNRDAPAVLGAAVKNYHDNVTAQRLGQISKFDPTYTKLTANSYAQSVMGQDLTPDEQAVLDGHLRQLITQRAGYIAGANNTADGQLQGPTGFTRSDVEEGAANLPGIDWQAHVKGQGDRMYRLGKMVG